MVAFALCEQVLCADREQLPILQRNFVVREGSSLDLLSCLWPGRVRPQGRKGTRPLVTFYVCRTFFWRSLSRDSRSHPSSSLGLAQTNSPKSSCSPLAGLLRASCGFLIRSLCNQLPGAHLPVASSASRCHGGRRRAARKRRGDIVTRFHIESQRGDIYCGVCELLHSTKYLYTAILRSPTSLPFHLKRCPIADILEIQRP